jgi:DNA recombination protein RmuC
MLNILLLVLLILTILFLIYIAYKLTFAPKSENTQTIILLQNQIADLNKQLSDRLDRSHENINRQLQESNQMLQKSFAMSNQTMSKVSADAAASIKDVTEKLTKLDETNKQVVNFATQLQSLENILKNPKQRGILGEYFLESLLSNTLPPSQYKMQYPFTNGEIVDAVIFVKDHIIPIDAKFSLEKYNQIMEEKDSLRRTELEKQFKGDIKNRIDETAKYIRPSENTTEFAFMFIPAEGIFYNLLIYKVGSTNVSSQDLIEYAFRKRVIIVSPTSFFAYLQTVLQALKSLQVEESVKEILKNIQNLDRHLKNYDDYMLGIGKNLATTVNKYNEGYREFKKIDKDIAKITDGESTIDPLFLEKPQIN